MCQIWQRGMCGKLPQFQTEMDQQQKRSRAENDSVFSSITILMKILGCVCEVLFTSHIHLLNMVLPQHPGRLLSAALVCLLDNSPTKAPQLL